MSVLPKEINYTNHASLPPNSSNLSMFLSPANGSVFTENGSIQFDLPSSGYLDPSTMYLKYTMKFSQNVADGAIRGTPAASPFVTSQVFIGSTSFECINQYGVVYNLLTNLKMDLAMKASAPQLGYIDGTGANLPDNGELNGTVLTFNSTANTPQSRQFALPLMNILTGCEKLLPLFAMPAVRIQLTLDSQANYIWNSTGVTNGGANNATVQFTDFELVYDQIQFGQEVDSLIRSNGPITIKSSSWASMGQAIAATVNGSMTLPYNMRYSSIRSLFMTFGGTSVAKSLNLMYDSYDITSSNGSYCVTVNGTQYPSRVLNVAVNKMGVLMELKQAINGLHDVNSNCMSLLTKEWNVKGDDTTSIAVPGKFWFGVNLEKLSSNSVMLSGISTRDSAINFNFTTATPTPQAYNALMVVLYDALLQIDPVMRDCKVVQ